MNRTKSGEIIEQQRNREQWRTIDKQKNRQIGKQKNRQKGNQKIMNQTKPVDLGPEPPAGGPGGRREGVEGLFTMMIMLMT